MKKRIFDLVLCVLTVIVWSPALLLCATAIWLFEGRPILYISTRRVFRSQSLRLLKFRTMIKNAEKIVNRDTVPTQGVRFLNIPLDSPLYTRTGRIIEQCFLTELPQIFHVLKGGMSIIGNRPLPENVISALKKLYPQTEDRFLTKCGLTGPVQLVGREALSDEDRLMLEIEYCRVCLYSYSLRLDFMILLYTVLIAVRILKPCSISDVHHLLMKYAKHGLVSEERLKQQEQPMTVPVKKKA